MALGKDYSRIYLYNLSTGRRESLGEFDGQVLAPRYSPTGPRWPSRSSGAATPTSM